MDVKAFLLHNKIVNLIMMAILCCASVSSVAKQSNESTMSTTKKILVVYFSRTGNTEQIAKQIQRLVGGDLFEIRVKKPYPEHYDATTVQAKKEKEEKYTPPLVANVTNLSSYDVVFVGYPIWWGTIPAPIRTFIAKNKLSDKTIIPFSTHGGGGQGQSVMDIKQLVVDASVLEGFVIEGAKAKNAEEKIKQWLTKIGID